MFLLGQELGDGLDSAILHPVLLNPRVCHAPHKPSWDRYHPKGYYTTHELCNVSHATGEPERAVNGLLTVAQLLEEQRLARLYTFVLRDGEVTIDDIVEELDIPRTTAYSDTGSLVEIGALVRDDEQKTHTYRAEPIELTADLDGDEYTITPTLIEAFGRAPRDQDIDLLLERHGLGKLAAALTYAVPYVDGTMSEHIATRELDLQHAFGVAILHALQAVIEDMREHDPYFDHIRDARDHPPANETS